MMLFTEVFACHSWFSFSANLPYFSGTGNCRHCCAALQGLKGLSEAAFATFICQGSSLLTNRVASDFLISSPNSLFPPSEFLYLLWWGKSFLRYFFAKFFWLVLKLKHWNKKQKYDEMKSFFHRACILSGLPDSSVVKNLPPNAADTYPWFDP